MKNQFCALVLFVSAPLFSCSTKNSNENNQKKIEIDENSYVMIRTLPDGRLLDSITYTNGKANGLVKVFDTTENYIFFKNYKNGIKEGKAVAIYEDNSLYYEGYYRNDLPWGEWTFYNANASVQYYKYYDSFGELAYVREYDSEGKLVKSKGNGIIYIQYNKDTLIAGEEMELNVYVASPPNSSGSLIVSDDSSIVGNVRKIYDIESPLIYYNETFFAPGVYNRYFIWKIREDDGTTVEEKRLVARFYVFRKEDRISSE